jgi:endonuclease YncB( thermonuclease family)
MKKIIVIFILLISMITLHACQTETPNIVISKVFDATSMSNNVIELYNPSEEDIDLSKVEIRVYNNGSTTEGGDHAIQLHGTLESGAYYALTGNNPSSEEVESLADHKHDENLPFNGNDVIELFYSNQKVDQFGLLGFDINFAVDLTMIRLGEKEDYLASTEYDQFNFIAYIPDLFEYLKTDDHEIKTLDQLYQGPQLEQRYIDAPYVDPDNSNLGFGGAAEVDLISIADGDTAFFSAKNGYPGGSLRYFYINTPEVDGSNVSAEPWGYVASKYNKEYLLNDPNSKTIQIQSIPGNSLREGYGRNLGLVWVNGALSQFWLVAEGLSEDVGSQYQAYDYLLTYKNVPYLTFLRFAQHRAEENGWGTKGFPSNPEGEKSPDWNYDTRRKTTENPVWTPHLKLPWE